MTSKTAEVPEVIALYREDEDEDEDGTDDQPAGWAMVIPETGKVVIYVAGSTGVGSGLVNAFASPHTADRVLSHMGIYPAADLATLPAPR
ncbi:MAG: hypothetical protein ACRDRI_15940 [Pseudonocardiaceae bacterium]